jgi:hypothetical protein
MRLYLTLCLIVVASLAGASSAQATTFTGERPADALVQGAVVVAQGFWTDRGVTPCAHPTVLVADDLTAADGIPAHGRALVEDCTLWLLASDVAEMHSQLRPGHGGDAPEAICTAVVHEMGHLAGLEHTETGIMSAYMPPTPWACSKWAAAQRRAATARVARVARIHRTHRGRCVVDGTVRTARMEG